MSIRVSEPLPECELCDIPTARAAWEDNGHLCTACCRGIADTVRMLPVRSAAVADLDDARARRDEQLEQNAQTVFVERWLPPVPGQLTIDTDDCDQCDGLYTCPTCR